MAFVIKHDSSNTGRGINDKEDGNNNSNEEVEVEAAPSRMGDGYISVVMRGTETRTQAQNQDLNNTMVVDGNLPKTCPPGVSLLANKFLLLPENPRMRGREGAVKPVMACVNIRTKELFSCKILPRNPKGLALLAAYHRLDESSAFVNQVIEAILTPKVLYLIMPRNHGNVHSYLLEKKMLEEPEAANIFKQMVDIVQHCHAKGVVLRDIKLGRFVFVDKEKTKIKLDSLEDSTLLLDPENDNLDDKHGCPNYVSPEKAETLRTNKRYPGKASDVWCLGVMLHTMLSGRYPFNDQNQARLLSKIKTGNFIIPPGLSSSVTNVIKAILKKSPAERPTCAEILRSPWLLKHCRMPSPIAAIEPDQGEIKRASEISAETSSSIPNDQVVPNIF